MSHPRPPGPKNARFVLESPRIARDVLGYFVALSRRYPDPLVHMQLGWNETYIANHPDVVQQVLVSDPGSYSRTKGLREIKLLIGEGLLSSEESVWIPQRRRIRPAFHKRNEDVVAEVTLDETQALLSRWEAASGPVDVQSEAKRMLLAALVRLMFSPDATVDVDAIIADLDVVLHFVGLRSHFMRELRSRTLGRLGIPGASDAAARAALERLDAVIYGLIRDCRSGELRAGLLIAPLLEAEARGEIDEQQIHDEVGTLFLAGFDTTAALVTFCLYALAARPELQDGLAEEAGQPPAAQPLTRQVLLETLRLYPPVWAIHRITNEPVTLEGFFIKRNEHVLLPVHAIQRNPVFWEDPEAFRPQRFADAPSNDALIGLHFHPFGAGRHTCIGKYMALQQAHLVVTTILQQFALRRASTKRLRLVPGVIVKSASGVPLVVSRRSTSRAHAAPATLAEPTP